MTDDNRELDNGELLESLTRLKATITTFSMDLVARRLDHEAHLGLALTLLDVADQALKHLLADDSR